MTISNINETASRVLAKYLRPGPAALLDFQTHRNVGDSLIYMGQHEHLLSCGVDIKYTADFARYDRETLHRLCPSGPLLLQGGGSFGDRWPAFQDFRERVIQDNPDRDIVQLPQSIEFRDSAALQRAQDVYRQHPSITLLMRDRVSEKLARTYFPEAHIDFCPDLAAGLGELRPSAVARWPVVFLRRSDSESALQALPWANTPSGMLVTDWSFTPANAARWKIHRLAGVASARTKLPSIGFERIVQSQYPRLAAANVSAGIRLLSSGESIITDRLHGAVLGALLGKNTYVLANSNGKIANAYADYLHSIPNLTMIRASDLADLVATLVSPSAAPAKRNLPTDRRGAQE